ncbi:DMT family transporter [Variovorax paradoxus]|nr:DMT family transporter [Variovorax paradoxus]MBT2301964.1 DMT family transporter [Variovorax paradoxus]
MSEAVPAQRRALAVGLALILVWGASFSIQKACYAAMSPGGFLFFRSLLMSVLAVALMRFNGLPLWPRLDRADWRLLIMCTLFGQVMHIGLVTYGIHLSTAFTSSVIMACGPVITLVLLRMLHGARLRLAQLLGVAAALAGVLLFLADKLANAEVRASRGDLLMLAGAALFSLYTIRVVPLLQRHGGTQVMCWTTLLAAPAMMAATAVPAFHSSWEQVPAHIWLAFVWSATVSAFGGWLVWSWVNLVRGVARTAPLLYLVPPVAGLIGWIWLGESLGPWKLLGAGVAMAGVAMVQWPGPRASNH